MNGHDEQGIEAYGPGDGIELMAAILATHDEAADEAWRMEVWSPSPHCPICGWELIPVEDGRMICPDCGHEEGEAGDDPAAEIAALNKVRYTIAVHPGGGWTATAADWPGGDQWTK